MHHLDICVATDENVDFVDAYCYILMMSSLSLMVRLTFRIGVSSIIMTNRSNHVGINNNLTRIMNSNLNPTMWMQVSIPTSILFSMLLSMPMPLQYIGSRFTIYYTLVVLRSDYIFIIYCRSTRASQYTSD